MYNNALTLRSLLYFDAALPILMLHYFRRKIVELEEELRVVGNNLKSLEVSEEKVSFRLFHNLSFPVSSHYLGVRVKL